MIKRAYKQARNKRKNELLLKLFENMAIENKKLRK
jgi:hypothetical protein